jgi:Putative binding domain, N-terminal/Viral BACON domain
MIPPGDQAFAQPRRSSRVLPRSRGRLLGSSLALVLAFATVGCESKSSTSTGPSPVKCQVSLEAPANTIDAGGGKDAITVSTQPECSWTASSGASWISGLTPASGQGSGQIEFQAAANPAGTMRQGDIAVNDQHVPVQQKPATCRYEVTPATQTVAAGGGTVTIAVTTLAGCNWQASVEAGWIAITATSGTGSGDVNLRVDPNGGGTRSAALLVAGQTVTLTQSSSTPASPNCVFTLARSSEAVAAAGAAITVAVSGGAGCSRTAASEAPWMTVVAGATGTGNGAVTFNVASNTGAARTGTVTIAGLAFTVTQAAAAAPPSPGCSFSIAPNNQSIGAGGGGGTTITISTSAGCAWTATSQASWITLTSLASGNGPGTATFSVAANSGGARSGNLAIAGQTFTVNQAAAPPPAPSCSFSIAPNNQSIGTGGGNGVSVAVSTSAGCAWTATSNNTWITLLSGANGNGAGVVTFRVAANTSTARTGTLTIAGRTFTVNQAGCAFSINPTKQSIDNDGGAGTPVAVSAGAGCGWTATSNDSWITVTSGASGSGNGTVRFNVASNNGKKRTGTLTIAGHSFTVEQDKD